MRFFEQVERTVLPNGFTVVTDHFPEHPHTAGAIVVASGSFHDPVDRLGCAHMLEHLLVYSHPTLTKYDYSRLVRRLALRANLSTSLDSTYGHALGRTASVMAFMDMVAVMFSHGGFRPEDVETERGPIWAEMNERLSRRDMQLHYMAMESVFGPGARAAMPVGGTPEHLELISYADLQAFRARHFVGNNMMFVSAGGLSHKDAVAFCEGHFGALEPGERQPRYGGALRMRDVHLPEPERQGVSMDMRLRFDASCVNGIAPEKFSLYDMFATRILFEELRLNRGLVYGVETAFVKADAATGTFNIQTSMHPDALPAIVDAMRDVVSEVVQGSERFQTQFAQVKETVQNIFEEHAIDLSYDMGARCKRLMEEVLDSGIVPDPHQERKVLAAIDYEETLDVLGRVLRYRVPTVEYRGHTSPDLPSGTALASGLGVAVPARRGVANRLALIPQI